MSNPLIPERDIGLESAETLVARILDFITSDPVRVGRFLHRTGIRPEIFRETAQLRSFMLNVIDAILTDAELLAALDNLEHIGRQDIELAHARLMFQAASDHSEAVREEAADEAIREKVKQLLRALASLMRERQAAGSRQSA